MSSVERAAVILDYGAGKVAGAMSALGEGLANVVEGLFFGGASRKAPGGAEYQQPTAAPEIAAAAREVTAREPLRAQPEPIAEIMPTMPEVAESQKIPKLFSLNREIPYSVRYYQTATEFLLT